MKLKSQVLSIVSYDFYLMNQSVTAEVLVAEMFAEVSLAFLLKILPVLVAYRQVDFEVRLAVEAESVVGMDQVATE